MNKWVPSEAALRLGPEGVITEACNDPGVSPRLLMEWLRGHWEETNETVVAAGSLLNLEYDEDEPPVAVLVHGASLELDSASDAATLTLDCRVPSTALSRIRRVAESQ